MAWNGLREDYTTTDGCQCHNLTGDNDPEVFKVFEKWSDTKHAVAGADDQA